MATLTNTLRRLVDPPAPLAVLSLAAAAGAVAFRLLGTRTTAGRHFDSSAVQSGLALPAHALNSSDAVLTAVSLVSFVVIGGLLVGTSRSSTTVRPGCRHRRDVGGSFGTTEFLKSHLHHRAGAPGHLAHGFPSGHSTVALALGLSFVLVTPDRRRPVVATAAALYAALMGATLVFYRVALSVRRGRRLLHRNGLGGRRGPDWREGRSSAGSRADSSPLHSLWLSSPRRLRCTCDRGSVSA